ncbi:phosphatase, partial [Streptomyces sp. SID10116]|nr:phosphatase [Streptomyces sp. SID10116]
VGARRGLAVIEPADGLGPETTIGLGLGRADLGHIETVPRRATSYGRILDADEDRPGTVPDEIAQPDLLADESLDPRHREVAAVLGYAASYALSLSTETAGRIGAAVWLYDEPAEPDERRRHLVGLYARQASEHVARLLVLDRARTSEATLRDELMPS